MKKNRTQKAGARMSPIQKRWISRRFNFVWESESLDSKIHSDLPESLMQFHHRSPTCWQMFELYLRDNSHECINRPVPLKATRRVLLMESTYSPPYFISNEALSRPLLSIANACCGLSGPLMALQLGTILVRIFSIRRPTVNGTLWPAQIIKIRV